MSGWQDPFSDDEAAQERAARRADRERRRREEDARESLGERVREGLSENEAPPPADPPPAATPPPSAPVVAGPSTPAEPEPATEQNVPSPAEPAPPPAAPPPPHRPSPGGVNRRRVGALVALGVLIAIVAALGTIISRNGDDDAPAASAPKAKKTIEFVVPEGFDRTQVADVAKKEGLKGDYLKATQSFKGFDPAEYGAEGAENLEGFLFPATYELFKGATVEDLVAKQLEAFEANLSEVDAKGAEERGYAPYELVIIASMVEREIAVPEERKLAASVIYNRLDDESPLGIDATIRFEDQNYSGQLVLSRLEEDTPYNTRTNAGLPPGPIGNPGLASLEAAASPAETDFFYFVVKPGSCNEHTFVETEAEFASAEADYQAALQAEGGSPTEC